VIDREDRDTGHDKTERNRSSGAFLSQGLPPSPSAHVVPTERAVLVMTETITATITIATTVMTESVIVPTVPITPEAAFEERLTKHPMMMRVHGRERWIINLRSSVKRTWHYGCAVRR